MPEIRVTQESVVSKYEAEIDFANPNDSHVQVAQLVGEDKRVLDVGCWTGNLGRTLRQLGCNVTGVDVDPDAAATASTVLNDVKVADVDLEPLAKLFDPASFDAVIFADVLQHLKHPEAALVDAVSLLAPEGRIVISVPNVAHGALRLALLQGRWRTTEEGLLDAAHLRFYTRQGLFELLDSAGLQADELRGVVVDPLGTEVDLDPDAFPSGTVEWVREQPDALVYQFQVSASVVPAGREPIHTARLAYSVNPDEIRLQDRFTDQSVSAAREALRVKDHIIGLQAEATTATRRAAREASKREKLNDRLTDQKAVIAQQKRRIQQLERQGFVGFMRRVKRKLT